VGRFQYGHKDTALLTSLKKIEIILTRAILKIHYIRGLQDVNPSYLWLSILYFESYSSVHTLHNISTEFS